MAKILLVDDSEILIESLLRELKGAGHTVVYATDGMDGYQCFLDNPGIELIVTDIAMPRLSGLAMLDKIKNQITPTPLPAVIILSANVTPDMKDKGKHLDVKNWVVKSHDFQYLLSVIAAIG